MSKKLIVAIDGPAGSGKSTSAKIIAQKLNYLYIDTGAMYRAVTFLAIKQGIMDNPEAIVNVAENSDIRLKYVNGVTQVFVDGIDITKNIRTHELNDKVSSVSKIAGVRKALVKKQRMLKNEGEGIVMEGRDIGTVVFPDADVKIFLTALLDKRAERRAKEYEKKGTGVPVHTIKDNLSKRDALDSSRDTNPLIKANDAFEVDSSKISIEEQVELILQRVKKAAVEKGIEILSTE
ncbi:MAG: (d)CMP kinase [Ignavibacteriaceae bacterium]|nr:(d)CMP kinase [Ignavibacteriaceae bacterium]